MAEFLDVLYRPGLARFIEPELRADLLGQIRAGATVVRPTVTVTDCRDPKDNKYLELALAANAATIVSSDEDLLVLHPWRGVRILKPAAYLAETDR
jgi:putative PIN family toxin of toxin-antitoxin system